MSAPHELPQQPWPFSEAHLPGLDGLRGIAVLMVVVGHFASGDRAILDKLGLGVDIFFVLSGFLITYLMLRDEMLHGNISLPGFYIRRGLRILPPLLLYLGVLGLFCLAGAIEVPATDFLAGIFFFRNYVGASALTGHLWSLAIEEQFYLVWPLALVLLRSPRARVGVVLTIVIASPFWRHLWILLVGVEKLGGFHRTDFRLDPIATGALLAIILSHSRWRKVVENRFMLSAWPIIVSLAFLAWTIFGDTNIRVLRAFVGSLSCLSVAVIINAGIRRSWLLSPILDSWPLAWLGTISYGLYLWQQPFARLGAVDVPWFQQFPANVVLSLACTLVSFYCLEKPLMALRRGVGDRFRVRPTVA